MSSLVRNFGLKATDLLARLAVPLTVREGRSAVRIPVLCYHRVLPNFREDSVPAYSVRPEQFEAHLKYLSVHGYQALTLHEYEAIVERMSAPPRRAVLLTFDDGFTDNFAVALPIAKRFGLALNFFICTGLVEGLVQPIDLSADEAIVTHRAMNPELWRPISWDQIRAIRDSGHGVGFHSHLHNDFGQLRQEEMRADISKGLAIFEQELGFRPRAFAFPYGTEMACPPQACETLREAGLPLLFSTRLAVSQIPPGVPVPRIMIYEQDSLETFALKLSGAYDWLGNARALYQAKKANVG